MHLSEDAAKAAQVLDADEPDFVRAGRLIERAIFAPRQAADARRVMIAITASVRFSSSR